MIDETPSDTAHPEGERELLPCPFCGAEAVSSKASGTKFKPFVQCISCYADMVGISHEDAITAWNTRPTPPSRPQGEEGLVTFPREPTREMWAAMGDALVGYKQRHHDAVAKDLWNRLTAISNQGKPSS